MHLTPRILKQDTNMRKPLEPGLRLAMTLCFLAMGESFKSMCLNFRVGPNTFSLVVKETCEAIIKEYMQEVIQCPTTPEGWKAVAVGLADRWQFHLAIGALDGNHIAIQAPNNMGLLYYNYKGFHSIVFLALVDADYKFMYVDVGTNGSSSDAGIFQTTDLRRALEDEAAGLPQPEPLPGGTTPIPYFIVGDETFPMRDWLHKPYPHRGLNQQQRAFNYRLSRARRVVENAFGILVNRLVKCMKCQ